MKKEYRKAILQIIKQYFSTYRNGKFGLLSSKNSEIAPGDVAFTHRIDKTTSLVVAVHFAQKDYQEFFISVGWSNLGDYPRLHPLLEQVATRERTEFDYSEFLCDIQSIEPTERNGYSISKEPSLSASVDKLLAHLTETMEIPSPEEAIKKVMPVVTRALGRFETIGSSYLNDYHTHIASINNPEQDQ